MINTIITASLFAWGIHAITREGMLFGFVQEKWDKVKFSTKMDAENDFLMYISKLTTECPPCMSFWWGLLFSLYVGLPPLEIALTAIAASGLSYIISGLILRYD